MQIPFSGGVRAGETVSRPADVRAKRARRGGLQANANEPRNAAEVARNKERRIAPALLGSILRGEKYRILRAAVLGSRRLERRLSYAKPNFPAIMILAQSFAYVKE